MKGREGEKEHTVFLKWFLKDGVKAHFKRGQEWPIHLTLWTSTLTLKQMLNLHEKLIVWFTWKWILNSGFQLQWGKKKTKMGEGTGRKDKLDKSEKLLAGKNQFYWLLQLLKEQKMKPEGRIYYLLNENYLTILRLIIVK